jgi:hypothetical protein
MMASSFPKERLAQTLDEENVLGQKDRSKRYDDAPK